MTSSRPALKTADYVIFTFLVGAWTLPWAALGAVMFAPWLAPSLFTPLGGNFSGVLLMYAADGLGMPLMLLAAGIEVVARSRGWWWLVAWTATVAIGFAYEDATLPFLISMFRARATLAGHWHWAALAWGSGFGLLAAVAGLPFAGPVLTSSGLTRSGRAVPGATRRAA